MKRLEKMKTANTNDAAIYNGSVVLSSSSFPILSIFNGTIQKIKSKCIRCNIVRNNEDRVP